MSSASSCHLVCVKNLHPPIVLPDGEPVKVGRSPQTLIQDKKVSRNQVELTADYSRKVVVVKQLGNHSASINDTDIQTGNSAHLTPDSVLCILAGEYPQKVEFTEADSAPTTKDKKRAAGERQEDCKRQKNTSRDMSSKSNVNDNDDDDDSDDESEERRMMIAKKLQELRDNAAKKGVKKDVKNGDDIVASTSNNNEKPELVSKNGGDDRPNVACGEDAWEEHGNLMVFYSKGTCPSSKIAAFDMDGVIIITASGKKFPTSTSDWQIMLAECPGRLKKLHKDGYKIVFVTNQMGIQKGKIKKQDFRVKIENIVHKLGVPIQVFVAAGSGEYRKPCLGMWWHLTKQGNGGVGVDMDDSFLVGDAAGRPEKWAPGKKKDFACSDRLFSMNIGIKFHTPEEYFLGQKPAKFDLPEFDPRAAAASGSVMPDGKAMTSGKTEVVVCVGLPASGKSHFSKTRLVTQGYVHVNRDTLGTWQKCVALCADSIKAGKSVVVDNTNVDAESRKRYIDVAARAGVPCRCFHFPAAMGQCRHNERFRELTDKTHKNIPDMIMHSLRKKFAEPKTTEGFDEVLQINHVLKFDSPKEEKLYRLFLMDK